MRYMRCTAYTRLGQIIVRACLEDPFDRRGIFVHGHEDHRDLAPARVIAHNATELRAIHTRHIDVEDQQLRCDLLQRLPETQRVGEGADLDLVCLEEHAHRREQRRVVVDDQHTCPLQSPTREELRRGAQHLRRQQRLREERATATPSRLHAVGESTTAGENEHGNRRCHRGELAQKVIGIRRVIRRERQIEQHDRRRPLSTHRPRLGRTRGGHALDAERRRLRGDARAELLVVIDDQHTRMLICGLHRGELRAEQRLTLQPITYSHDQRRKRRDLRSCRVGQYHLQRARRPRSTHETERSHGPGERVRSTASLGSQLLIQLPSRQRPNSPFDQADTLQHRRAILLPNRGQSVGPPRTARVHQLANAHTVHIAKPSPRLDY